MGERQNKGWVFNCFDNKLFARQLHWNQEIDVLMNVNLNLPTTQFIITGRTNEALLNFYILWFLNIVSYSIFMLFFYILLHRFPVWLCVFAALKEREWETVLTGSTSCKRTWAWGHRHLNELITSLEEKPNIPPYCYWTDMMSTLQA